MTRRFNKFGLRRDLNFADLANPQQSLDNILNGLVDVTGESFISQDLDAIRDIGATTITNNDFRNITGAAVKVTDSTGEPVVYKPVVKFKNRLDVAEFTVGEPNFYGGDGLTSRYYESNQINSTAVDVNNIFTGPEQVKEVFWERGIFNFVAKINDRFNDIFGGVAWNGFFRPTIAGRHTFSLSTSGFYTFEIDDGTGNLIVVGRKSQINTNIVVNAASSGAEFITLATTADIRTVLVGDVIIHPTIAQFVDTENSNYTNAVTVTGIDYVGGRVKISGTLDANLPANTTLTFRHRIGNISSSINYVSVNLEQYRTYRIRYRFWIPNITGVTARAQKTLSIIVAQPNTQGTYLDYKWLYNEDYNINPAEGTLEFGDFRKFFNSKLSLGGGAVGGSGSAADYRSVITKSPFTVSYVPPTSFAAANVQLKTVNTIAGSNILPMALTDGIAVGQFAISGNILSIVKSISINEAVFLTSNVTQSLTNEVVAFVDHRGIRGISTSAATVNNNKSITVSEPDWNSARVGEIVVGPNLPQWTVITRKIAPNVLVLSDTANTTSNVPLYFYHSAGIRNFTLTTFCNDVVSAPTVLQSNAGATTLTVAYIDGIGVGDRPQFGTRIPAGTTVTAVNTGTKVITLSASITDDIPAGQLITFAPIGTTDNKELCFPPIDTSPPFTSTAFGLSTTTTRPTINIAPIGGALGELRFVGLSANGVPEPVVISPTANYTRALRIRDATGAEFRILSTT